MDAALAKGPWRWLVGEDGDAVVSVGCGRTGWDRADILCLLYFKIRLSSY